MKRSFSWSRLILWLVICTVLLVGGFYGFRYWTARNKGGGVMAADGTPATPVNIMVVGKKRERLWNEYSGRLHPVDSADIRPEVSGRIDEVRFKDGQDVKAGDIIFVIEPDPYEAAVARAKAQIAQSKANLEFTVSDLARFQGLLPQHGVSQQDVDRAKSAKDSAEAALQIAQAQLQTVQVDLDRAYVKAPISGRTSRAELTVGNYVQAGDDAPVITSIVSNDGIYADFEVDEQTYLAAIQGSANGNVQEETIPVDLRIPGDDAHVYHGFMQNFDNQIDTASGTIRARAKFPNTDHSLVPGMFVSVHLASGSEQDTLFVADRAIAFDQSKRFVLVVDKNNKVIYREVTIGLDLGDRSNVTNGLVSGDRVIVDGLQRVHPGDIVNPTEVTGIAPDPNDPTAQSLAVPQN